MNGSKFDPEKDVLSEMISQGEQVYAYARKMDSPETIADKAVEYTAECIWKGRKTKSHQTNDGAVDMADVSESDANKARHPLPLPSAATEFDAEGNIVDLPSGQHGILALASGEKVLFPRSRVFIEGKKLKGKEFLLDHFKVRINSFVTRLLWCTNVLP